MDGNQGVTSAKIDEAAGFRLSEGTFNVGPDCYLLAESVDLDQDPVDLAGKGISGFAREPVNFVHATGSVQGILVEDNRKPHQKFVIGAQDFIYLVSSVGEIYKDYSDWLINNT